MTPHPAPEEWMSYLYGEAHPQNKARLEEHLHACRACAARVAEWRGAMGQMDAWQLPARPARAAFLQPLVKWAAAAMLVLGLGYAWGHLASPASADVQALRTVLEPILRQKLQAELTQQSRVELETMAAAWREQDRQTLLALLEKLEKQHAADYAALRRDLETVAVVAEGKLEFAQEQISQLFSFSRPVSHISTQNPNPNNP